MNFENQLEIGIGIYTPSEIAQILRLPYHKIYRWLNRYWDGELGKKYESKYSWQIDKSKAVSFHTLIEFYVMMQLSESGIRTREVLKAHLQLSKWYDSSFPFAIKEVLQGIETDKKKIYFRSGDNIITLDGSNQLNLQIIESFFSNLDFDSNNLASRYWPMGKQNSIVLDPKRKFGHPVIENYNIYPETIYKLYKAGDPIPYIAHVYELTEQQVNNAIEFCQAA
jgi:uncharacterized protein (DUF433 family)